MKFSFTGTLFLLAGTLAVPAQEILLEPAGTPEGSEGSENSEISEISENSEFSENAADFTGTLDSIALGAIEILGYAPEDYDLDYRDFSSDPVGFGGDFEAVKVSDFAGIAAGFRYKFDGRVSASFGVMTGVDFRTVSNNRATYSVDRPDTLVNDLGTFYGAYLRIDAQLSKHWSISTAYRHVGSEESDIFSRTERRATTTDDDFGYNFFSIGAEFGF